MTSLGNARSAIYKESADYEMFLDVLERVEARFNWLCHAYCLMDNHYHLMIETPDGNLVAGMRQLNGVYTQRFNRRHKRVGHVLQGRFKAILVDRDSYLLELCRYVVLNPARAKMVPRVGDYRWSSYRATVGMIEAPSYLTCDWVAVAICQNQGICAASVSGVREGRCGDGLSLGKAKGSDRTGERRLHPEDQTSPRQASRTQGNPACAAFRQPAGVGDRAGSRQALQQGET